MSDELLRVLLIEDDPADARLIREQLLQAAREADVRTAARLAEGLKLLEGATFDCVLVDLTLPDSTGVETAVRTIEDARGVPVIVLTGQLDETVGEYALRLGVKDYLLKDELSPRLLWRAIRYARARHALDAARQERDWLASELASMERVTGLPSAPITAKMYGSKSLREGSPPLFRDALAIYGAALDSAVEASIYKVENRAAMQLRDLAVTLARAYAGPRDVVELHSLALTERTARGSGADVRAYVTEGRILVLELMGRLLSVYRSSALAPFRAAPLDEPRPGAAK